MKKGYIVISCFLAIGAGRFVFPGSAPGETLERLFYTPGERARLEKLRLNPPAEKLDFESSAELYPAAPIISGPSFITLSGMVLRNDGNHTIWLNGESHTSPALPPTVKLRRPDQSEIEYVAPISGKTFTLKPGQTVDVESGQLVEPGEPAPSLPPMVGQIFKRQGP